MMTPTATVFVIDDHEAVRKSHPLPSHLIWLGVPVAAVSPSPNHSDANDNP